MIFLSGGIWLSGRMLSDRGRYKKKIFKLLVTKTIFGGQQTEEGQLSTAIDFLCRVHLGWLFFSLGIPITDP